MESATFQRGRYFNLEEAQAVAGEEGRREPRSQAGQVKGACQVVLKNLNFIIRADNGELF